MRMSHTERTDRLRQALWKAADRLWFPALASPRWRVEDLGDDSEPPIPGLIEPDAVADFLHAECHASRIVELADRILAGQVELLGFGAVPLGQRIDWHADPSSGRQAPRRHWSRIAYLDRDEVGDSRLIWELSRHRFLVTLGQAYRLSGERRYAVRAWEILDSWIRDNPPGVGINWTSSLEVAFRAIAWCWLWHLAPAARFLAEEQRREVLRVLGFHARHIERYFSTYFSPNTHLTGEALGLCYIASFFPASRFSSRWWQLGERVLLEQLGRQIESDGMHFERSPCYHLYSFDFYLHYALLRRSRSLPALEVLRDRLVQMAEVVTALARPDGIIPNIGDDDGGRLIALGASQPGDVSPSLALASALLDAPHLWRESPTNVEAIWILGPEWFSRARRAAGSTAKHSVGAPIHVLGSSGFVICRAAGDYVLASLGLQRRDGTLPAHSHDDALSVELWIRDEPVLVDPGTFTYTGDPDRRRWYRSAAAHNAPIIDGEPRPPSSLHPFRWDRLSQGRLVSTYGGEKFSLIEMCRQVRHGGDVSVHRRRVVGWYGVGWVIWDRVHGWGTRQVELRYQFASVPLHVSECGRFATIDGWSLTLCGGMLDSGQAQYVQSSFAPRYGRLSEGTACSVSSNVELPVDTVAVIRPGGASQVRSRVEEQLLRTEENAIGRVVKIVDATANGPAVRDLIVLAEAPGAHVQLPGVASRYLIVWIRLAESGRKMEALVVGGSPLAGWVMQLEPGAALMVDGRTVEAFGSERA